MKPVVAILLSDKRSGSTMFESELCMHPDINHVAYSPHAYRETHHWLKAACMLNMPKQLFYGNRVYRGYGSRKGARRYMIDCIRGNAPDFTIPRDDETLIFEGWNALCRKYARPVFFEKSPQHPHHWAALDVMMKWAETDEFDVRFIGLVRNPMAVMYSAQALFSTDPVERQFGWAHCYRNILAMREMVGKDRFCFIRYEDLIRRPKPVFGEICEFLGLDHCDNLGEQVHQDSVARWIGDPAYTLKLHDSVARVARTFGYRDEDLYNPPKPGLTRNESFRRYLMGKLKLAKSNVFDRFIKPAMLNRVHRK
ncbi:MAG: sulfotransferase [Desulfosalsimonadaceae bacterium]